MNYANIGIYQIINHANQNMISINCLINSSKINIWEYHNYSDDCFYTESDFNISLFSYYYLGVESEYLNQPEKVEVLNSKIKKYNSIELTVFILYIIVLSLFLFPLPLVGNYKDIDDYEGCRAFITFVFILLLTILILSIISLSINLKYVDVLMNKIAKEEAIYSWNIIMTINIIILITVCLFIFLDALKIKYYKTDYCKIDCCEIKLCCKKKMK